MNESGQKVMTILKEFVNLQTSFYAMRTDDESLRTTFKSVMTSFNDAVMEINQRDLRNYYTLLMFFLCRKLKSSLENEINNMHIISTIYECFKKELYDASMDCSFSSKSSISPIYKPTSTLYTRDFNNQIKKSKRSNFPKHISRILKNWLIENVDNPYPTESEKQKLAENTGLDHTQINNWFINARRRIYPMLKNKK